MTGKTRCALHGAYATGPVTDEGKARTIAALVEGRRRWIGELKAKGARIPCGRKRGRRNRSVEERAQAAHQARCERDYRRLFREARAERRVRREAQRKEAADLERRRARSNAGLFWEEDEEAEALELAFAGIADHGVGRDLERGLARLARTFVAELNSPRPSPAATVEKVYRDLVRCGNAVPAQPTPAWLERVQEAYARWRSRLMVDAVIERLRAIRSSE